MNRQLAEFTLDHKKKPDGWYILTLEIGERDSNNWQVPQQHKSNGFAS
jgi:hypothetical protein